MEQVKEDYSGLIKKISCDELAPGMYVHKLDRPWLGTPFMFQGFYVKSHDEIDILQKYCKEVYINVDKERLDIRIIHSVPDGNKRTEDGTRRTASHVNSIANSSDVAPARYSDTVGVEEELKEAKTIYTDSKDSVRDLYQTLVSNGVINQHDVNKITSDIMDSVMRNPDAFMLLQSIQSKGEYKYTHAVNCCALTATFCRHMGFSKQEIRSYSMGALLMDVGITRLPDSMVNSEHNLNPLMMKLVRHHVGFGLEIVKALPELPTVVREIIQTHHERINGKGYPAGLKGEQIPVSGRIAAIVDCYNALTCVRPYKKKVSPTEAVTSMYEWRNEDFHGDLIEQFIQCIGAYPTGSLVELSTGQIGIVMSQNRVHRLYPKVLVVMDSAKARYEEPKMVDLWDYAERTKSVLLGIKSVICAEELEIDLSDYYV